MVRPLGQEQRTHERLGRVTGRAGASLVRSSSLCGCRLGVSCTALLKVRRGMNSNFNKLITPMGTRSLCRMGSEAQKKAGFRTGSEFRSCAKATIDRADGAEAGDMDAVHTKSLGASCNRSFDI